MSPQTMQTVLIESKVAPGRVEAVRAAIERMLSALDALQPDGVRYASFLAGDGETVLALVQFEDPAKNPLHGLPEYADLLALVEASRAEPPRVQQLAAIGSYRPL